MRGAKLRAAGWTLFAIAAGVVLYFTLKPGPGSGPFQWWDKAQHFAAYTVLALLAGLAARGWRQALLFAALLAAAGYGLEFVQAAVGRSYDIYDAVANALGCGAGFAFAMILRRALGRV